MNLSEFILIGGKVLNQEDSQHEMEHMDYEMGECVVCGGKLNEQHIMEGGQSTQV